MCSFDISYDVFGEVRCIPLIPGGSDILVTNANREEYVAAYIDHYCNISVSDPFNRLQRGFYRVCGGKALGMCRASELELLICGSTLDELDFKQLEEGAQYVDGYTKSHHIITYITD